MLPENKHTMYKLHKTDFNQSCFSLVINAIQIMESEELILICLCFPFHISVLQVIVKCSSTACDLLVASMSSS